MIQLLKKEFILTMHPTNLIFMLLAAMMLIPNYPYYVTFFYLGLGIFFTCLNGRECNDIAFSMALPVSKKNIVGARILFTVIVEIVQALLCIPFAFIRQHMMAEGNAVGMDANIAFFGLSFIMLGIFNFVFYSIYYKNVVQVGKAFMVSSTAVFGYMIVAEICAHAVPFFRDKLDTPDTQFVPQKLVVLLIGLVIYALLTLAAYKKSVRNFEVQDI